MPNGAVAGSGPSKMVPGAGWALALLLGINMFNFIDRYILAATLSKIRLDTDIIDPADPRPYTKLGALTTAFMVIYMLLSPVFGRLGDTMRRWVIIGVAVIVWSLATGGTGLATGYLILFLTRCLVGIGEAAYGPVAPAMISDMYPVDHRGRVMAWFYAAIPVGSALGFIIGSQLAESFGWRSAFLVAVFPGVALGVLCFFMKEPPRQTANPTPNLLPEEERRLSPPALSGDGVLGASSNNYRVVLRELRGIRSFVLCCAGMTASTFVLGGAATVMPLYFFEREARFTLNDKTIGKLEDVKNSANEQVIPGTVIGKFRAAAGPEVMTLPEFRAKLKTLLSPEEFNRYSPLTFDNATAEGSLTNAGIGLYIGGIVAISGLVATLVGGMAGDYLRNRGVRGAYFHVAGWGMIVAFPAFLAMLYTPLPLGWVLFFVAVFFLFFNTGPANTILANVVRSNIRATAFAINILIIHALGDAISPLIIGNIGDRTNLQTAFVLVSLLIPLSGILWIWGARYLDEDTRRAEAQTAQ